MRLDNMFHAAMSTAATVSLLLHKQGIYLVEKGELAFKNLVEYENDSDSNNI